jgi:hypothetical protein
MRFKFSTRLEDLYANNSNSQEGILDSRSQASGCRYTDAIGAQRLP